MDRQATMVMLTKEASPAAAARIVMPTDVEDSPAAAAQPAESALGKYPNLHAHRSIRLIGSNDSLPEGDPAVSWSNGRGAQSGVSARYFNAGNPMLDFLP
jgi:hypothetical protein